MQASDLKLGMTLYVITENPEGPVCQTSKVERIYKGSFGWYIQLQNGFAIRTKDGSLSNVFNTKSSAAAYAVSQSAKHNSQARNLLKKAKEYTHIARNLLDT